MIADVWTEKYRPNDISELILPKHVEDALNGFVSTGDCVNLLFTSEQPGTGKTTAAKALGRALGCETKIINTYKDNNIDTLRTKVLNFVSTESLTHNRKMVIFDEADRLTAATLDGLRGFIETYSDVRFVFTCNYVNRINDPVLSRLHTIDFNYTSPLDRKDMIVKTAKRARYILDENNIQYTSDTLKRIVMDKFPDLRQIIIELEMRSKTGTLQYVSTAAANLDSLMPLIKAKDYVKLRNWAANNTLDILELHKMLHKYSLTHLAVEELPALVYVTYDSQYKLNFVADKEIHLVNYLYNLCELAWN